MDYSEEDIGNIISLEHVNVQVPDQSLATLFYIVGMGFTRDPYINVGLNNMWANVGEQQFHLPTGKSQVIPGHVGIVVPDLQALQARLESVAAALRGTQFSWELGGGHITVTCPWGNRLRCYSARRDFGDMALGIPYVEFMVPRGRAAAIVRFYDQVFGTLSVLEPGDDGAAGRISIGRSQTLVFRETEQAVPPYDGHHIAIYVANFSRPYGFMKKHGLLAEDVRNHQFRFKEIIDPEGGDCAFLLEHEVRSLRHPMFNRFFVNRDPVQSQRQYRRGRDALTPFVA